MFNTLTLWQGTDDRMATFHLHHLGLLFLLEATPIRMATKDARTKTYRMLATVGVFHQAIRVIEGVPQMPGQTSFRIWKTPLIADCVVSHTWLFSIMSAQQVRPQMTTILVSFVIRLCLSGADMIGL